jgi:hypothetical protein
MQENQRQRMIRHHFHRLGKLGIAIPRYVADSLYPGGANSLSPGHAGFGFRFKEQIRAAGLEEQWRLLQTVPGIQDRSAANVLAETGADMQQFPTPKHLSSWAGLCPGNNRSAGTQDQGLTGPAVLDGV